MASISKHTHSQIKPTGLRAFHANLATWYRAHGRHDLPWRNTDDPYHIWLSEVMLQQTQVATVLARFYHPFLETFPTVKDLANAPREKVMKAWEGLGYYSRARNLHEAAKLVSSSRFAKQYRDLLKHTAPLRREIPAQGRDDALLEALRSLPGVGKNTAHAIAAFAYHQPVAILEANVKRVVARVFALERPSDADLWKGAEDLLNNDEPFDYNQAMMDVGALLCTPKNPHCGTCPANALCKGKTAPDKYPAPKVKKQIPTREVNILVREDAAGRLFLEKREEKLLGGLYGFPQSPHPTRASLEQKLHHPSGASTSPKVEVGPGHIGTVTHIYSHFKLVGHVVHEQLANTNSPDWHTRAQIAGLPLSKLDHKVLALVDKCNTHPKKRMKRPGKRRAR